MQCEAGGWEDDGGQDGAEESEFGMGDDIPYTVYELQQHAAQHGDAVRLTDVRVTSPPSSGEALGGVEFLVQELAGGPFSGLRIQTLDADVQAMIEPGVTVDIRGIVAQHLGYYIVRVESAADVTPTGTAPPPDPPVVAAAQLER